MEKMFSYEAILNILLNNQLYLLNYTQIIFKIT